MTVLVDDGVRRHLRFAKPGTYACSFDILTWPGHLCYTGDMGTFVFSRLPDMFDFFRRKTLNERIDFRYWAEKCLAVDKPDGIERFDKDRFEAALLDHVNEVAEEEGWDAGYKEAAWNDVRFSVLCEEDESACIRAAMDFSYEGLRFDEPWEFSHRSYTGRFLFCCFALPWVIAKYDALKKVEAAPADPAVDPAGGIAELTPDHAREKSMLADQETP